MSEAETHEQEEPQVTDVPEPDQEPHGPVRDEVDERKADEDDVQPETAQSKSEKEIEKALKAVERAGTTYRNAVSKAMGEDAQHLTPCPRCNAPTAGLIFPPAMAPVDDETREAVLASVGEGTAAGPPLQPAKGVETCPSCQGNGQLEYPTFVEHTRVQPCVKCQGAGYVTKNEQPETPVYQFPTQDTAANSAVGGSTWQAPDSWGRPFGHIHYGTPPAQVGV